MDPTRPAQRILDELGPELWRELVATLAAELPDRAEAIREASDDPAELEAVAHSLKGAALGLDLERLAAACHAVEKLARDGAACGPAIAALTMVASSTKRELDAALAAG